MKYKYHIKYRYDSGRVRQTHSVTRKLPSSFAFSLSNVPIYICVCIFASYRRMSEIKNTSILHSLFIFTDVPHLLQVLILVNFIQEAFEYLTLQDTFVLVSHFTSHRNRVD